jgi:hypothetical protein
MKTLTTAALVAAALALGLGACGGGSSSSTSSTSGAHAVTAKTSSELAARLGCSATFKAAPADTSGGTINIGPKTTTRGACKVAGQSIDLYTYESAQAAQSAAVADGALGCGFANGTVDRFVLAYGDRYVLGGTDLAETGTRAAARTLGVEVHVVKCSEVSR